MTATKTKDAKDTQDDKTQEIKNALLGYDPQVWMESDIQIRDNEQSQQSYTKAHLPPPVKGDAQVQLLQSAPQGHPQFPCGYTVGPTQEENSSGGTSWIELFILFDTTAARSAEGEHIKEPETAARAAKRKKQEGKKAKQQRLGSAITSPTLDEKLKNFKAIARHTMRRGADTEQR